MSDHYVGYVSFLEIETSFMDQESIDIASDDGSL